MAAASPDLESLLESPDADGLYDDVRTHAAGPAGQLPLDEDMLRNWPSGDLFGLSQDAGMGWDPAHVGRDEYLILSTAGGVRADDGTPIALGYHTGHWEVGLLVQAAACRTATTPPSCCAGSSARCRAARACWASRRATRVCRR